MKTCDRHQAKRQAVNTLDFIDKAPGVVRGWDLCETCVRDAIIFLNTTIPSTTTTKKEGSMK